MNKQTFVLQFHYNPRNRFFPSLHSVPEDQVTVAAKRQTSQEKHCHL